MCGDTDYWASSCITVTGSCWDRDHCCCHGFVPCQENWGAENIFIFFLFFFLFPPFFFFSFPKD